MKVELDLKGLDEEYVVRLLRYVIKQADAGHHTLGRLADLIEAQLPKPKPEEPTGLGAVVEDTEGRLWTNTGSAMPNNWMRSDDWGSEEYKNLDVVRVLSEGVTL